MKLLLDFRAFQEFYPRGVSRYVYAFFVNLILLTVGKVSIIVSKNKIQPVFDETLIKKIDHIYDISDFDTCSETFDWYIGGSACWLGYPPDKILDIMYPLNVLQRCKHKSVILYDFVPLIYQRYIPTQEAKASYVISTEYLKQFSCILTISQYTTACAKKYLSIPDSKLVCIYGGADVKKFHSKNSDKKYSAKLRTLDLVSVLGGCPRKNGVGLVKAFINALVDKKIPSQASLKLLSCNAFANEIDQIRKQAHVKNQNVVVLDYIKDGEMVDLIANARATIFPSFYEGLGLPILESYAVGTPCLASNVSSTQEFVNKESSFDPFNIEDITKKIIAIYYDEDLLHRNLEFGRDLIKKITWENAAKTALKYFNNFDGY